MFIQTIKTIPVIACIFISAAASAQSSQAYNKPVKVDQFDAQGVSDPNAAAHLQVSVRQPESNTMRFRVVVDNPFHSAATITIAKGDEVLYTENVVRGLYQNLFNLDQLEDGNYQIIVTSGRETIRKDISISSQPTANREAIID